eukprot:4196197-Prymnesium_polylepis.1
MPVFDRATLGCSGPPKIVGTVVVASRCAAYTPRRVRASTSTPSYPSWTRSTRSRESRLALTRSCTFATQ